MSYCSTMNFTKNMNLMVFATLKILFKFVLHSLQIKVFKEYSHSLTLYRNSGLTINEGFNLEFVLIFVDFIDYFTVGLKLL